MVKHIKFKFNGVETNINPMLADLIKRGYEETIKDDDFVVLIVGAERLGKSMLRNLIGGYWSYLAKTPFTVDNIHFNINDYMKKALKDKQYVFHSHDEARRDLNAKRGMSKPAVTFTNYFSECGDNNQAHCIILPAYCDIDKYIALWRAKLIIEVGKYRDRKTGKTHKGMFRIIKTTNRGQLAEVHKKKYSKFPKRLIIGRGRFDINEIIPQEEYKAKKQRNKEAKYIEDEKKNNEISLTPRQIEVLSIIKPSNNFKKGHKDYEVLQKLSNSLRKWRLEKSV